MTLTWQSQHTERICNCSSLAKIINWKRRIRQSKAFRLPTSDKLLILNRKSQKNGLKPLCANPFSPVTQNKLHWRKLIWQKENICKCEHHYINSLLYIVFKKTNSKCQWEEERLRGHTDGHKAVNSEVQFKWVTFSSSPAWLSDKCRTPGTRRSHQTVMLRLMPFPTQASKCSVSFHQNDKMN